MSSSPTMHVARFGGIAFDCIATADSVNRGVVKHTFPRKDGAHLVDMGAGPRNTRLHCIFFEVPPDGDDSGLNYLKRYERFYEVLNSGETRAFVHPIFGTYQAKVDGDIGTDATSDEIDALTLSVTFTEDGVGKWTWDQAAAQPVDAGISAVTVEAAKLDQALDEFELESSVATESVEQVSAWREDETISARRVNLELQSLSNKISNTIDELELSSNLDRQPIWRSMQRLQGEIRRAAQLFIQSQPQIFSFTVVEDAPLRVIVVDLYGSSGFDHRYEEIIRLNDIDDPLVIRAGTKLKATSPNTQRGRGLRAA